MLIVLSLHYRVIHPEPRNLYPCHDIPIDRTKPVKINFRQIFFLLFLIFRLSFGIYFCIRLLNDKFLKFLISNSCLMVSLLQ